MGYAFNLDGNLRFEVAARSLRDAVGQLLEIMEQLGLDTTHVGPHRHTSIGIQVWSYAAE